MSIVSEIVREGKVRPDIVELYKAYEKASNEALKVRLSFGREGPCSNPQCYEWIELKFETERALRMYYEGLLISRIDTLHCMIDTLHVLRKQHSDWLEAFDKMYKAILKSEAPQ